MCPSPSFPSGDILQKSAQGHSQDVDVQTEPHGALNQIPTIVSYFRMVIQMDRSGQPSGIAFHSA